MSEFNGRIGHLEGIESPWANAGGVAKTVDDVEHLAKTGIGWIEDGSQTLEGRLGNAYNPEHPELGPIRKVYHHDPKTGRTFNSFGMPGKNIDVWSGAIPEKVKIAESHGKKFVQNVAPVSDSPAAESEILVRTAYSKGAPRPKRTYEQTPSTQAQHLRRPDISVSDRKSCRHQQRHCVSHPRAKDETIARISAHPEH